MIRRGIRNISSIPREKVQEDMYTTKDICIGMYIDINGELHSEPTRKQHNENFRFWLAIGSGQKR